MTFNRARYLAAALVALALGVAGCYPMVETRDDESRYQNVALGLPDHPSLGPNTFSTLTRRTEPTTEADLHEVATAFTELILLKLGTP